MKIGVFIGSLRKESYNRKIANELIKLAPASLDMEILEIGHLPFYNQDSEVDLTILASSLSSVRLSAISMGCSSSPPNTTVPFPRY